MNAVPLLAVWVLLVGQLMPRPPADIQPEARTLLAEMTKAYRSARSLVQDTIYAGDGGTFTKPVHSRLAVQRPNKLLLEMTTRVPTSAEPVLVRLLSDGKDLYSYQEVQRYYTKSKAPRNLSEFASSAVSLEMALLTGADLLTPLQTQARSVRTDGKTEIAGEAVDVVLLDLGNPNRTTLMRLFLSEKDHLIRKVTIDAEDVPRPDKPVKKREVDPLNPDELDTSDQDLVVPPAHFAYENTVQANMPVARDTFQWTAPAGVFPYQPLDDILSAKGSKKPGKRVVIDKSRGKDGNRLPDRPLSLEDLLKIGHRQRKL